MAFGQDIQNMAVLSIPSAIYSIVVHVRSRLSLREVASRLGLTIGTFKAYFLAVAVSVPGAILAIFASTWTSHFQGSMLAPFVGAPPTLTIIGSALSYGVIATGFPEELLFRGLIAGTLFRRMSFIKANFLQAAIFMLPHLLILLVAPQLWLLAIVLPLTLGLIGGWLRHTSGSIFPSVLIHATTNAAGALWVLNWSGVLSQQVTS